MAFDAALQQQLIKEWLAALRSGEYSQIKATLESKEGFCCLGVLCNVAKTHKIDVLTRDNGTLLGSSLGSQKAVWAAIQIKPQAMNRLIGMNDGGRDFKEIASYIEENIANMFLPEELM